MTRNDIVLIYLSLYISIIYGMYCKELKHAAYLEGRIYQMEQYVSVDDLDGRKK
jgi:hypothetical protein